jgi:hypothetical protein
MRIIHAIPAYHRDLDIEVAFSAAGDAYWCAQQGWEYGMVWCDVVGVARARNLLFDSARRAGADLLLFQDSDSFPMAGSGLHQLWDTMQAKSAAVVGAVVRKRNIPQLAIAKDQPVSSVIDGDVGTAYMLIDLRQTNDLPRPLFVHRDTEDGLEVACGEDFYFCRLARKHGLGVFVDYRLNMGHVGKISHVSGPALDANVER